MRAKLELMEVEAVCLVCLVGWCRREEERHQREHTLILRLPQRERAKARRRERTVCAELLAAEGEERRWPLAEAAAELAEELEPLEEQPELVAALALARALACSPRW